MPVQTAPLNFTPSRPSSEGCKQKADGLQLRLRSDFFVSCIDGRNAPDQRGEITPLNARFCFAFFPSPVPVCPHLLPLLVF